MVLLKKAFRSVLEKDLGVDTSCGPPSWQEDSVIARFVYPEDRNKVWSARGKLKESITHADAYITDDYARAVRK